MEVQLLLFSYLLFSFSKTLAYDEPYNEYEYETLLDYGKFFDDDMNTTASEEYWPEIDAKIEAREKEYYRIRRQILIDRFSGNRERITSDSDNRRLCPVKCTCSLPNEVHCTFRFLSNIPEDLPSTIEKLNMGYNKLSTLPSRVFDRYSANLRILFLHSNDIRSISNSVFSKLSHVEVLRLSWNKITGIRKIALHGLHNIERLYLDNNRLSFIHPLALRGLTNLKLLQLDGNRLSRLHQDIFVTVEFQKYFKYSSIQYLYLSLNMFENLPRHIFDPLQRLRHVYMQDNKWECSCQLRWLKQWMHDEDKYRCKKNVWNPSEPEGCAVCKSPGRLAGLRLQNISSSDFTCESPFNNLTQDGVIYQNYSDVTDPDEIAANDDETLFRFSGFYSTSMNIRLDSRKRSVFHATCNLTHIPKVKVREDFDNQKEQSGGTISRKYIGMFEAVMHCSAEYPQNVSLLHDILNPYLDQTLNLTFVKSLKGRLKKHQSEYVVSTARSDLSITTSTPITGAGISSSSTIMRTHTSLITLHSKNFNPELRTVSLTFNTTVSYTHTSVAGQYTNKPWVLIKQPYTSVIKILPALEKKTTTIRCKAVGQPKPTIRWVLPNNILLRNGETNGRLSVSRSGRLFIRRSATEDSGIYRCIVTVSEITKNSKSIDDAELSTIRLVVLAKNKSEKNSYTNLMSPIDHVQEGGSWNATCTINGFPYTTVQWITPNHQMIQSIKASRSKRFSVNENGTLHVEGFEKSDQGTYRCVAANLAGYAEQSVTAKFPQNPTQTEALILETSINNTTPSQHTTYTSIVHTTFSTEADMTTTKITPSISMNTFPSTPPSISMNTIPLTPTETLREPKRDPTVIPDIITSPLIPSRPNTVEIVGVGPPDMNVMPTPTMPEKSTPPDENAHTKNMMWEDSDETIGLDVTEIVISGTVPKIIYPVVAEMEVIYKSRLHITCNATGHPAPNISWSHVGNSTSSASVLIIEKVTRNSTFECRASNEYGNDTLSVTVLVKPTKPELKEGLAASVSALEGLSVRLDCSSDGFPEPSYIWYFPNNSVVNSTQDFLLLSNGSFVIRKVNPTLSGIYRCTSENDAGKVELNVKLIVTVPPTMGISSELATASPKPQQKVTDEPTAPKYDGNFTMTPKDFLQKPVVVRLVQRITLAPEVDVEIPTSSVVTTRIIKTSDSTEMTTTAQSSTTNNVRRRMKTKLPRLHKNRNDIIRNDYIITPAISIFGKQSSRRGWMNYLPTAGSNKDGHLEGYRTKNKVYDYSYAVQGLHDHHILLPCNARIPAGHHGRTFHQIRPHLQSFTWTLPSGLVYQRSSPTRDWRYFLFGNGTLMIRGLTMKDIGMYRCQVKYKRDNIEIRTRVLLHIENKKPYIHEYPYDYIEIKPGETVKIPCTATGNPKAKITWTTPTGHIIELGKWHNRMNIFSNGTLMISNIHSTEVGRFVCTASNIIGKATRTVQVGMSSYPPKFLHPKNIVKYVRRGGSIKLICSASGMPSPSYSWMLPNKDMIESNQAIFQGRITPPKLAMLSSGTLIINRADSSNEGRYYCTAKNQLGRDVALVVLRVYK